MHAGSSLDDFLEEEGILEEVTIEAQKRVLAWQIAQEMERQHISKAEMARRMETSRSSLDRLLDPEHCSVTLMTMHKATRILGKTLEIRMV